jgi:hypothetical protein
MTGGPCKLDCFWDNGNGSGNDDCYWDHMCDPLEVAPDYHPEGIDCAYDNSIQVTNTLTCDGAFNGQSQTCYDYCGPLVPNGCDCFGCCTFPELTLPSGQGVWLGSMDDKKEGTCTIDDVSDPSKCQPCTIVPGCGNPCETCEICIGKPELPPECGGPGAGGAGQGGFNPGSGGSGGAPTQICPTGFQPCGLPGQSNCPVNEYCITGCCVPVPN